MTIQRLKSNLLPGLMIILLKINLLLLLWYIFVGYRDHFHSDSASKVLLAREIFDSGQFFPKDWNYVNGDLFIVFGHILIVPLLHFLPAGYVVHAISGSILSLMILVGVWLLVRNLAIPSWRKIAVVVFFAAGVSGFVAENLFGQVSYGVVVLMYICILLLTVKFCNDTGRNAWLWGALILVIFFLAYWSNPKRALVTYGLPFMGSLGCLILRSAFTHRSQSAKLLLLTLIGSVAGSVMHGITLADVSNVRGAANAYWLNIDSVPKNMLLTLKGLYAQLDGFLLGGSPVISAQGLFAAVKFALATVILVMMPLAIKEAVRAGSKIELLTASFAGASITSTLFLQISTSLPDMSDPIQSSRYLVPGVTLGVIVLLTSPFKLIKQPLGALALSTIVFVYGLSGYSNFVNSSLSSEAFLGQPGQVNSSRAGLIEILESRGLKYGYATYWNAGVLSVLSDEKVKVRQVHLVQGKPMPMRHLSSNSWYRADAWKGRTFLLVHAREENLVDLGQLSILGLSPVERLSHGDFTILIFDRNIAELPGWDVSYLTPARFSPNVYCCSQTGELIYRSNSSFAILVADIDDIGALYHGPYVQVEAGRYRATFDVEADFHPEGVLRLDVATSPDQGILAEATLTESETSHALEFTLTEVKVLEFRVWALARGKITFGGVTLQRIAD